MITRGQARKQLNKNSIFKTCSNVKDENKLILKQKQKLVSISMIVNVKQEIQKTNVKNKKVLKGRGNVKQQQQTCIKIKNNIKSDMNDNINNKEDKIYTSENKQISAVTLTSNSSIRIKPSKHDPSSSNHITFNKSFQHVIMMDPRTDRIKRYPVYQDKQTLLSTNKKKLTQSQLCPPHLSNDQDYDSDDEIINAGVKKSYNDLIKAVLMYQGEKEKERQNKRICEETDAEEADDQRQIDQDDQIISKSKFKM